jgi:hypothetical protein
MSADISPRSRWPFVAHLVSAAFVFLGIAIFDLPVFVTALTSELPLPTVIVVDNTLLML